MNTTTQTPNAAGRDILALFTEYATKIEKGRKLPAITREAKIRELGIDSVAMMEIIGCIEDDFSLRIPDEKLAMIETVADIERVIVEQSRPALH